MLGRRFLQGLMAWLLLWGQGVAQSQEAAPVQQGELVEQATGPRQVLWVIDLEGLSREDREAYGIKAPAVFLRALSGAADKHGVTARPEHLAQWLKERPWQASPCLSGVTKCKSPLGAAMEGLGLDLVVRGRLTRSGARWSMQAQVYGPDGRLTLERALESGGAPVNGKEPTAEAGLEEIAYACLRELFDATGTLEVVTEPPGAQVVVDGKAVGVSPVKTEVAVGLHDLEVLLDDHSPLTRSVRVSSGKQAQVKLRLTAKWATLTVDSTPVLGQVFVNAQHKGSAGEPILLAPGEYELEVQAEGYKSRTLAVKVEAEEVKVMSLTLEPRRPALQVSGLGEVETDSILARRYYGGAAYRFSSLSSGLSGAEGALGSQTLKLQGLLSGGELSEGVQADFGYHGLHLEVGYFWERWGVAALGLSIFNSGDRTSGQVMVDSQEVLVDLDGFSRVEFKPAQLLYRHPYKNLFPTVQAGFGYAATSFQGTLDEARGRRVDFTVDGFFFSLEAKASYFFDTWWFAHASLGIQRDLSHDDSDTQTFVGFGLGLTLDDPLGELGLRESATPPRSVQGDGGAP